VNFEVSLMGWKVQHSASDRPVEPWEYTGAGSEQDAIVTAGRLHRTRFYVNAIMSPDSSVHHHRGEIIVLLGKL
jgi:hypothetical protein